MKIYRLYTNKIDETTRKKFSDQYFTDVALAVHQRALELEALEKAWRKSFKGMRAKFSLINQSNPVWEKDRLEYNVAFGKFDGCTEIVKSPWFYIETIEVRD